MDFDLEKDKEKRLDIARCLLFKRFFKMGYGMTEEQKQQYLNLDLKVVVVNETDSGKYKCVNTETKEEDKYESFEVLPEKMKKAISILKLLDDGHAIISLGKKIKAGKYWVYLWE